VLYLLYCIRFGSRRTSCCVSCAPRFTPFLSYPLNCFEVYFSKCVRYYTFMWPSIVTNFFVIKPTRCTNFTNLFCHENLHVSDSSSVRHQGFIHCTLSRSICSCSKAVYKPVWHIPLLSVQWINPWWWTDELSETWRFSGQNKFVKLVHLFGFITKKYVRYCLEFCARLSRLRFYAVLTSLQAKLKCKIDLGR